MVAIGSGPIRIGQGIEFDYGCVHAVMAIRSAGMDAILINNNPETVSTDFDTSDRLYFDPLTNECVSEILLREKAHGILLQFGGQTAINLAIPLEKRLPHLSSKGADVSILGTTVDGIDEASDRERFEAFAKKHGLRMPNGATGTSSEDIRKAVDYEEEIDRFYLEKIHPNYNVYMSNPMVVCCNLCFTIIRKSIIQKPTQITSQIIFLWNILIILITSITNHNALVTCPTNINTTCNLW